jgi:tetratricopeptide (TPR) repeat protein
MKKSNLKYYIISIVIVLIGVMPLDAQDDLAKAANLYKKNDYKAAVKIYETIIKSKGESAELYYNIGNCYYKLNETALSILNYERALRIRPYFDDAQNNLELARSKVIDNIVQTPDFFIKEWVNMLVIILHSDSWFYISVVLFILSLLSVFLFLFSRSRSIRKSSFYTGVFIFSLCVLSFIFSGIRKNQMLKHNEAIIMTGIVIVKSSPDRSGTDLFQLHEGTKVKVKSSLGEWSEITIGNGDKGWIETNNIENI